MSPMTREGPFWDVLEGRADPPAAATTLGWELIGVDPEAGTIEIAFLASEAFLNPAGTVQGGFLAGRSTTRSARRWWQRWGERSGRRRATCTFSSTSRRDRGA